MNEDLYVLYLLRNNLIELFFGVDDLDLYLTANELLLRLETIIIEELDEELNLKDQ